MFNQKNFGPVSASANSDFPKLWSYRSDDDTLAAIVAPGYFQDKINQIKDGEYLVLNASDTNSIGAFVKVGDTLSLNTNIVNFSPSTDLNIERILDGSSATSPQEPTGVGPLNAIQINFGPAVNDATDPIMLSALGALTINESKLFRIKVALQFGRTGASGTSILLFRAVINGIQAGRSIISKLGNAEDEQYFENDTWIFLPAGTVLTFDLMRDSAGTNSGGLFGFDPTIDAGNEWEDAPSAAVRVEGWL